MSPAELLEQRIRHHPKRHARKDNDAQGAFWKGSDRSNSGRVCCERIRSLAQTERFGVWSGRSGRRYTTSIYSLEDCPDYEHVVALAVIRAADGARHIIHAFDLGAFPLAALGGSGMAAARAAGASEIHLHLLAPDAEARKAVIADLS